MFKGCASSIPDDVSDFVGDLPKERYDTGFDLPPEISSALFIRALIGVGSFSEVVRVENKLTHEHLALKIIKKSECTSQSSLLATELAVVQNARHPNIVTLFDVIESPAHMFLVLELAMGGDLLDRVCQLGRFKENVAARVTEQMLSGVAFMNSLGITHTRLKPENVLFYHPGLDSKVMLSDFGLTRLKGAHVLMPSAVECMAPEAIQGVAISHAADVWSVGVMLFFMLCGAAPFKDVSPNLLSRKIVNAEFNFEGKVCACV